MPEKGRGRYHWRLSLEFIDMSNIISFYPFCRNALRNFIHQAATKKFETEFWFDIVVIDGKSRSILEDTKNDLYRRFKHVSASDIIASLTFGFWTTLIKQKTYANRHNSNRLWPDLIPAVFPYYPRGNDERKNISDRFEEIKLIRNRLFHHEPVWKFKNAETAQECIAELRRKFNDIFKAIGWISKYKRNCLREFDFVKLFKDNCTLEVLDLYRVKGTEILQQLSN